MNLEDVHWSLLRPGDAFINGDGRLVYVAAVTLTGWVWDTSGDAWHSVHPSGLVKLARPVSQFAKDMDVMQRYADKTRDIIIEVRG